MPTVAPVAIPASTPLHIDMETGEVLTPPAIRPGTDLAPAAIDGEWITKESRIQTLESLAADLRNQWVHSTVELGRVLGEHAELCREDGQRVSALFDRLGFTRSAGYRLIAVARTVADMPRLRDLANQQYSHVVALIEGCDESTIAQIANDTHPELDLDAVSKMSVKQLRHRVRHLETDKDKIVAEETKTLRSEVKALTEDLAAARAALDPDIKAVRRTARQLREAVQTLADTADQLMDQLTPLEFEDVARLREVLDTSLQSGSMRLKEAWGRWQDMQLELPAG